MRSAFVRRSTICGSRAWNSNDMPPVVAAANTYDVMSEQLEYLNEHKVACPTPMGCRECKRWADARKILMEPFAEPERVAKVSA